MTNQNKPSLDEQTFERLLEAAFVLQEHHRKMRELASLESQSEQLREQELSTRDLLRRGQPEAEASARTNGDYTVTLAEIVEAQRQIQMRHLDFDTAMGVVAERAARITGASGAAIAILTGKMVRYPAGAGTAALPAGSEVPLDQAICQASVRTGQVIRTEDVNAEFLFDPEEARRRQIQSLVAVPVYRDGDIVGALELYFDRISGFIEQDIHTCQLMAGLVTEAIGRDAESKLKSSMAAERSTMLAAIEKLQPNLAAWAQAPSGSTGKPASASVENAAKSPCWKCGNDVLAEEQFCGKCGAARSGEDQVVTMQSKVASAWHTLQANQQRAGQKPLSTPPPSNGNTTAGNHSERAIAEHGGEAHESLQNSLAAEFPELFSLPGFEESAVDFTRPVEGEPGSTKSEEKSEENELLQRSSSPTSEAESAAEGSTQALVKPQSPEEAIVWSSAAKAQHFLESLSAARTPGALARFWRFRRGDFYLALAVILVVAVFGWGLWSNHSVGAGGSATSISKTAIREKRPSPDTGLSAFDRLLIALGLAEAEEPPEYKGNPDTQVWVDLNTALYYCPGADLYEKTAKGKLSSQRDAQLDQFEPAYRKACD